MAWTAMLITATTQGANVMATVRFQNGGGEAIDVTFPGNDLDDTSLKNQVLRYVELLEARDRAKSTLTLGPITFR